MSKKRVALKISSAGAVTALYAAAAVKVIRQADSTPKVKVRAGQVVIVASVMTALTWIAAWA